MAELREWPLEEGVVMASAGNLFFVLLCAKPSIAQLDRIVAVSDEARRDYPDKQLHITIIPKKLPAPDGEYRRYSSRVVSERRGTTLINILAVEGDGFWAAAMRLILTGIEKTSKQELEVVASIDAAIDIVADRLEGVSVDEAKAMFGAWRDKNLPAFSR